jgi:hypothetical protein
VPGSITAKPTLRANCARAQVYLNYCASWYGQEWSTLSTQAYCLCLGAAPSATSLVYVPEVFDGDARACAQGYSSEAAYWSSLAEQRAGAGTYGDYFTAASSLAHDWAAAEGFCAANRLSGVSSDAAEELFALSTGPGIEGLAPSTRVSSGDEDSSSTFAYDATAKGDDDAITATDTTETTSGIISSVTATGGGTKLKDSLVRMTWIAGDD